MKLTNRFLSILLITSSPSFASINSQGQYSPETPQSTPEDRAIEPANKRIKTEENLFSDSSSSSEGNNVRSQSNPSSPEPKIPSALIGDEEMRFTDLFNRHAVQVDYENNQQSRRGSFILEFCSCIGMHKRELIQNAQNLEPQEINAYINPDYMDFAKKTLWMESVENVILMRHTDPYSEHGQENFSTIYSINANELHLYPAFNDLTPEQQTIELKIIAAQFHSKNCYLFQAMHNICDREKENTEKYLRATKIINKFVTFAKRNAIIVAILNSANPGPLSIYCKIKAEKEGVKINYVEELNKALLYATKTERENIAKIKRIDDWIKEIVHTHHTAIKERNAQEKTAAESKVLALATQPNPKKRSRAK
jgi:hypothetical protein